ncbi:SDR family oxidoreductase [Cryobacterium sp. PH31-L1]|uniref:SDR family oxidoreductase n=1 Tax=Cryobacterium sp. PH31-L1 TaxID=3046199 RepID=UPI0024BB06ED|nr:SDR family oxidoreductase [Cryobacterium sp. PH31-L1]MDJ0377316.1 SDR family oxidoreductase [Cryobacterium sp. PH31-L1]
MDLGIGTKTALVLGAGGGLGGAIARALAAEGASVAVASRTLAGAVATATAITDAGGRAEAFAWDLANLVEMDRQVSLVEQRLGGIDILINMTGGPKPTQVSGVPATEWTSYFQSMVLPVIALTDRVLPGMRERQWGRIITNTSSGVIAPISNLGLSNALRSTLVGWSKTLAREVGGDGITANIVLPGRILTGRIAFLDEAKATRENRAVADVTAESEAAIPLGRYGTPDEYGKTVTFLASEAASYITGSTIRIDGGLIASV